ncbi:MAG: hypothetical protein ACKOA4_10120 [Haliscomenobacter sp.]
MKQPKPTEIDAHTIAALHQMNPWWRGNAMEQLPKNRRHLVDQIEKRFEYQLAPITVVRGSRQIGKTTACLHVISDLLRRGVHPNASFPPADSKWSSSQGTTCSNPTPQIQSA